MTNAAPTFPTTGAGRLRWAVADAATITLRALHHWARQPTQVVAGLLFPVMLVLLFGYLFGGSMSVPGGGDYREWLMPGMFVMTMAFGIGETMLTVQGDAEKGITDRFRSMPMARSAVVLGRSLADMLYSAMGLAVMLACGLAVGWRWHGGVAAAAGAVGLLLLLRFSVLWIGIYLGLVIRTAGAVAAVQTLLFPLTMVTNTFAAPDTMPAWLGAVATWNPLSATVSATRRLFGNPGAGADWVSEHALVLAVAWPLAIVALFLPLAVRRYHRLGR